MTGMDLNEWHARFCEQAGWGASLRAYIYDKVGLPRWRRLIDIGCGTGALLNDFRDHPALDVYGMDLDYTRVRFAGKNSDRGIFCAGNGLHLPFVDACFDGGICHYLLLWTADPVGVLREMRRVTRADGWVLALAEPDHGARVDWPAEFMDLGARQTAALAGQGADVFAGRKVSGWFQQAGLEVVETGVMGGQWHPAERQTAALEWEVLADDLGFSEEEVSYWIGKEETTRRCGERVLFVPVFYVLGRRIP